MHTETAIVVRTRWHPLWVLFFFVFRTAVTIDGKTSVLPWGEHAFQVEPGAHEVRVSLLYRKSETHIQVDVAKDQTIHLRYNAPFQLMVEEGKLEIIP